jgi:hypothetical protein
LFHEKLATYNQRNDFKHDQNLYEFVADCETHALFWL